MSPHFSVGKLGVIHDDGCGLTGMIEVGESNRTLAGEISVARILAPLTLV